jgi:dTMP kinase
VTSLGGDDTPAAWHMRDAWLRQLGGDTALADALHARMICASLARLGSPAAWRLRKLARASSPTGALASLDGLTDERAWRWRERFLGLAPRVVLRTIDGMDDARAWALRDKALSTCKEALDSIIGMDTTAAWALRERALDLWPSTVVKSLGALGDDARGRAMIQRQLGRHAGNLSLLKHAAALAQPGRAREAVAS